MYLVFLYFYHPWFSAIFWVHLSYHYCAIKRNATAHGVFRSRKNASDIDMVHITKVSHYGIIIAPSTPPNGDHFDSVFRSPQTQV